MRVFDYGEIADDSYNIGNHVLASLIVDPFATNLDLSGSWRTRGIFCPSCDEEVTTVTYAYCIHDDRVCACFYCPDCWLLFHRIEIGYLDEEGDYHEW